MSETSKPLNPDDMTPKRGEEPVGQAALEALAPTYKEFALGVIALLPALKEMNLREIDIILQESETIYGTVQIRAHDEGEATATVVGNIGGNAVRGVPYLATWTGSFYRRANPDLPYIVEGDHVEVEKDQMIAWGFVDKNTQWPILSDRTGTVHFVAEHGDETVASETVIYHIEARK